MTELHDHLLRGRKITVMPANDAPDDDDTGISRKGPWRPRNETRPTTLSLIKGQRAPQGTNAKISALEAKLASLASSPFATSSTLPHLEGDNTPPIVPPSASSASIVSLPRPDSLPKRPPALMPEVVQPPIGVSDFDSAEALRLDKVKRARQVGS